MKATEAVELRQGAVAPTSIASGSCSNERAEAACFAKASGRTTATVGTKEHCRADWQQQLACSTLQLQRMEHRLCERNDSYGLENSDQSLGENKAQQAESRVSTVACAESLRCLSMLLLFVVLTRIFKARSSGSM